MNCIVDLTQKTIDQKRKHLEYLQVEKDVRIQSLFDIHIDIQNELSEIAELENNLNALIIQHNNKSFSERTSINDACNIQDNGPNKRRSVVE